MVMVSLGSAPAAVFFSRTVPPLWEASERFLEMKPS